MQTQTANNGHVTMTNHKQVEVVVTIKDRIMKVLRDRGVPMSATEIANVLSNCKTNSVLTCCSKMKLDNELSDAGPKEGTTYPNRLWLPKKDLTPTSPLSTAYTPAQRQQINLNARGKRILAGPIVAAKLIALQQAATEVMDGSMHGTVYAVTKTQPLPNPTHGVTHVAIEMPKPYSAMVPEVAKVELKETPTPEAPAAELRGKDGIEAWVEDRAKDMAKIEAKAQAKVQAEEKVKAQAEAKTKADAEAKVKAEALVKERVRERAEAESKVVSGSRDKNWVEICIEEQFKTHIKAQADVLRKVNMEQMRITDQIEALAKKIEVNPEAKVEKQSKASNPLASAKPPKQAMDLFSEDSELQICFRGQPLSVIQAKKLHKELETILLALGELG
jgi:hypothetical protein